MGYTLTPNNLALCKTKKDIRIPCRKNVDFLGCRLILRKFGPPQGPPKWSKLGLFWGGRGGVGVRV